MEKISLQTGQSRRECITRALEGYFDNQEIPGGKEIAILPNIINVREENKNLTGISNFEAIKAVVDFYSEKYDNVHIVYALPSGDLQRIAKILELDTLQAKVINLCDEDSLAKFGAHQFEVFDKDGNLFPLEISAVAQKIPLVVLCVPKTHDRAAYTGNVKNQMGLITGRRGDMHNGYTLNMLSNTLCHYNLTRLHEYVSQYEPLYICDAYEAMEGNGPYGSNMRELGFGMVSKDAIALDSVTLLLMNLVNHEGQIIKPSDFAYLFMLNQKARQGRLRYGTLFVNIDELFEYENLNANLSKGELADRISQIGTLKAHRDIETQLQASRTIIDAVIKSPIYSQKPDEIIRMSS